MKRAALRTVVATAISGFVLLAAVAAPAAADEEVGLSKDGRTWTDNLTEPLFDPGFRWVPGDAETSSFYVRNRGPSRGKLTIDLLARDGDRLIALDDIALSARVGGGAWREVRTGGTTDNLLTGQLAEGATTRVDVRVDFAWLSPNRSQRESLGFRLRVTLAQSGPIAGAGDVGSGTDGAGSGGGLLPGTGSDTPLWLLWMAAMLLGGGAGLVLAARRDNEKETSHV